ncbi:MAG: cysteine desulfurase family protein [Myxococcota bacterium]
MNPRPRRIYLDHNATSPLRPSARAAMGRLADVDFGNPSSVHLEGRAARKLLERARDAVAEALGAQRGEVVLTSSATEANNMAVKGAAWTMASQGRPSVAMSAIEHPSVLAPGHWLAEVAPSTRALTIPVDARGLVSPEALDSVLGDDVGLVSVIAANNETGALAPIPQLAEIVHAHGALFHVDAAQAVGRIPVDVDAWGVDLLTLSSHKLGGPRGAGGLWVRQGLELVPLFHGGHQERNRRGGTEDVVAVVGFGAVCAEASEGLAQERARLTTLRDRLWSGLDALGGVIRIGDPEHTLPNTLCAAFEGVEAETLLMALDIAGVSVSAGSACTAGSLEPSHVLLAMGIEDSVARSAVRFSLGWSSSLGDIEGALSRLPELIERAREVAA